MNSGKQIWFAALAGVILLAGTLWGGWLHGRMVKRGDGGELLADAGKRLARPVSEQHGNWRLLKEAPFSPDVVKMLQCPAHINRTYMHQQTGEVVTVSVIVGPPGPIAAHTPEVCYSSQDFTLLNDRTLVPIIDRQQREHSFWQVAMEPRNVVRTTQRVLYAWGTGGHWSATGQPRLAHAGEPYLYKIQLAGPISEPDDEFNPCEDFLGWFLPEIESHLVPTKTEKSVTNPAAP